MNQPVLNQPTLGYLIRSLFVVLATVAIGMALSQRAGLSIRQSVLLTLPIGFFAASLMTIFFLAREGAKGNRYRQLVILLVIEFLLVPIASTAAIVAYFIERDAQPPGVELPISDSEPE